MMKLMIVTVMMIDYYLNEDATTSRKRKEV